MDLRGEVVDQGSTLLTFSPDASFRQLHAAVYAGRPDLRCVLHLSTPGIVAVSTLRHGLLPLSREAILLGTVPCVSAWGAELARDQLGAGTGSRVLLVRGQGALACGETVEEAWLLAHRMVLAVEAQLRAGASLPEELMVLPSEEEVERAREALQAAEAAQASASSPASVCRQCCKLLIQVNQIVITRSVQHKHHTDHFNAWSLDAV